MKTTHGGLPITEANWVSTLGHIDAAFKGAGVGPRERQELRSLLDPLKREVVAPQ